FITPASTEKSINFWLAARLVATGTLLYIAFRPWRPLQSSNSCYGLMALALLLVAVVYLAQLGFPQLWPRTFIEGGGLTPLKIGIEWLIIVLLAITGLRLM